MKLVYLHGFLSSPLSQKAVETAQWMQANGHGNDFLCPRIPMEPTAAGRELSALFTNLEDSFCIIGSSLGGFFATWAVEEFGGSAVLINPAVAPYALIRQYLGPQVNYQTGETHEIRPEYADHLRAFERRPADPGRYWLLSQTGDEVLDYRQAVDFYAGCRQDILPGGSHGFENFAGWLPAIWDYACAANAHGKEKA